MGGDRHKYHLLVPRCIADLIGFWGWLGGVRGWTSINRSAIQPWDDRGSVCKPDEAPAVGGPVSTMFWGVQSSQQVIVTVILGSCHPIIVHSTMSFPEAPEYHFNLWTKFVKPKLLSWIRQIIGLMCGRYWADWHYWVNYVKYKIHSYSSGKILKHGCSCEYHTHS